MARGQLWQPPVMAMAREPLPQELASSTTRTLPPAVTHDADLRSKGIFRYSVPFYCPLNCEKLHGEGRKSKSQMLNFLPLSSSSLAPWGNWSGSNFWQIPRWHPFPFVCFNQNWHAWDETTNEDSTAHENVATSSFFVVNLFGSLLLIRI